VIKLIKRSISQTHYELRIILNYQNRLKLQG